VDTMINLGVPDSSLMDSIHRHIDSLGAVYLQANNKEGPQYILPEWQMFLVVLGIVYLLVVRPVLAERKETKEKVDHWKKKTVTGELPYDHWLCIYNPYYNSLSTEGKKRFLERTRAFMQAKEFRFHAMVEEEYIPVLISSAAVQMTFGLRNYLMDYFPVIHIIRNEYVLNVDKETYYGHVSRSGIYISWNHFLEGYHQYDDSVNVGLHEMAHAVSFDAFLGDEDRHDRRFKNSLENFAEKGRLVFRGMKQGQACFLDDYAATNLDEFWAVCVETFFENPEEFQLTMPDLYLSICNLLNQNPLKPEKIMDPVLAGLAN